MLTGVPEKPDGTGAAVDTRVSAFRAESRCADAVTRRCLNAPSRAWDDRGSGAFTLLELLVVIGIVALLLGILVPVMGTARFQVRTVKGLSHLSQIGRGIHAYANDYDDVLPVGYLIEGTDDDTNWTTLIQGYLTGSGMSDSTVNKAAFLETFQDPNARLPGGRVHYSAHPILMPDLSPDQIMQTTYNVTRLVRTAQVVLVMDGTQDPSHQSNSNATAWRLDDFHTLPDRATLWARWRFNTTHDDNAVPIEPGPDRDAPDTTGHIRWRQIGDGANFLFYDGHAATHARDEITKSRVRVD